ncbi:hypothetical protein [Aquibacillus salsiterrae]|nr:hypothetical protein [Aquibacillus salsiterrae]
MFAKNKDNKKLKKWKNKMDSYYKQIEKKDFKDDLKKAGYKFKE